MDTINKNRTVTGTLIPDQRGKFGNHNAHTPERVATVHEHIRRIPVRSSHYRRKINKHVQYIDYPNKVPVSDLYIKYKEFMYYNYPDIKVVTEPYYRTIFNNCYYIKTVKPKLDVCDYCEVMDRKIKDAKADGQDCTHLEESLKAHNDKAQIAYDHLHNAKLRNCGIQVIG